jgi:hypothetical protein
MNPASKDIATYLAQEIPGLVLGTNLFYSRSPELDYTVTIMDNSGTAPLLGQRKWGGNNYHYSSVAVYVKNQKYDIAWAMINDIVQLLHGEGNIIIGGTFYALIKAMEDPSVFVYDDNNRAILLVNFEIQRRST